MTSTGQITEHMEVVGSDGGHVGTVDRLERGQIRLTKRDDPDGTGAHHHAIPLGVVAVVEAGQVRLTLPAQQARAMAVGGLPPEEFEVGTAATDAAAAGIGKASGSDENSLTGNIQGGGTTAHGGAGLGDGRMSGRGTGGGGTTTHGYLGGGPGIPDDPNMDPHAGRGPEDV